MDRIIMLNQIKYTAFNIKRFLNKKRLNHTSIETSQFPMEFDPEVYKQLNSDLINYSKDELYSHYLNYGLKLGKRANSLKDRIDFIKLISKGKKVLEIGPFCNPLLSGENVFYFDILDKTGLIRKAKSDGFPQNPANCPTIHFVSEHGDLSVIDEKFDIVLSSHCIEHQVNLVKHLNDVAHLLNPAGYYFLLAPDKRYCFDHYMSLSNLGQIIESHIENKILHSLRSFIECRALTTHNDAEKHWKGDHGNPLPSLKEKIENAIVEHKKASILKEYVDLHAWYFTPNSFKSIIEGLHLASYIQFTVARIYPTRYKKNEFWAILKKT